MKRVNTSIRVWFIYVRKERERERARAKKNPILYTNTIAFVISNINECKRMKRKKNEGEGQRVLRLGWEGFFFTLTHTNERTNEQIERKIIFHIFDCFIIGVTSVPLLSLHAHHTNSIENEREKNHMYWYSTKRSIISSLEHRFFCWINQIFRIEISHRNREVFSQRTQAICC